MSQNHANKSTNVRTQNHHGELTRLAARMARLSPQAAAREAAAVFLHPTRTAAKQPRPSGQRRDVYVGGRRLATWIRDNNGPRVLFVHGWSADASSLGPMADKFASLGFTTVQFDAPAHGESEGQTSSLVDVATAVSGVAEAAGPIDAIVAHSIGGAASVLALHRGLRARAVVLIGSPHQPHDWLDGFSTAMGLDDDRRHALQAAVEERVGVAFDDLRLNQHAQSLTTPALLIHDRRDSVVPIAAGSALHRSWRGSSTLWTDGLGHQRILLDPMVMERASTFVIERMQTLVARVPVWDRTRMLFRRRPRSTQRRSHPAPLSIDDIMADLHYGRNDA